MWELLWLADVWFWTDNVFWGVSSILGSVCVYIDIIDMDDDIKKKINAKE